VLFGIVAVVFLLWCCVSGLGVGVGGGGEREREICSIHIVLVLYLYMALLSKHFDKCELLCYYY